VQFRAREFYAAYSASDDDANHVGKSDNRLTNTVIPSDARGECRASFSFTPKKNNKVIIGPVVCQ